jgi:hypothetical protein
MVASIDAAAAWRNQSAEVDDLIFRIRPERLLLAAARGRAAQVLETIRPEPRPGSRRVPVRPVLGAEVKFFGRHRNGMSRDGVVRAVASIV